MCTSRVLFNHMPSTGLNSGKGGGCQRAANHERISMECCCNLLIFLSKLSETHKRRSTMNKERNKRVQIRLHIYLICTITKRSKRQYANVRRFFAKIKQKNKQFTTNIKLGFTIFIILIYPLIFNTHHSAISSMLYIEPIDIKICLLYINEIHRG